MWNKKSNKLSNNWTTTLLRDSLLLLKNLLRFVSLFMKDIF